MPIPPYRLIADDLRRRILDGGLPAGATVPSENALAAEYGVAPETARRALGALAAEGLTEARRGSRTRVRAFRPILRSGTRRVAKEQWGNGRSIWQADLDERPLTVDQLTVERRQCPAHVVSALGLEQGADVWVRDRRYVVEGEPVMLATSYLPAVLVEGSPITEPDPGVGGIYARLADLGAAPVRFREQVRSRMPLAEEAAALRLGAGTPVVLVVRFAYADQGRPVEVNEMILDSSRYLLEWEFPT